MELTASLSSSVFVSLDSSIQTVHGHQTSFLPSFLSRVITSDKPRPSQLLFLCLSIFLFPHDTCTVYDEDSAGFSAHHQC